MPRCVHACTACTSTIKAEIFTKLHACSYNLHERISDDHACSMVIAKEILCPYMQLWKNKYMFTIYIAIIILYMHLLHGAHNKGDIIMHYVIHNIYKGNILLPVVWCIKLLNQSIYDVSLCSRLANQSSKKIKSPLGQAIHIIIYLVYSYSHII